MATTTVKPPKFDLENEAKETKAQLPMKVNPGLKAALEYLSGLEKRSTNNYTELLLIEAVQEKLAAIK